MKQLLTTRSQQKIPLAITPIQAGYPSWVAEEFALLDVAALISKGNPGILAFEVTGDSMVPAIEPGSLIFVDPTKEPRNGDVVAAEVDSAVCVKIFQRSTKGLYLVSANGDYPPREITEADNFRVLGVLRAALALYG